MPHEPLLHVERCFGPSQQGLVLVPEGVPADAAQADCGGRLAARLVHTDARALSAADRKPRAADPGRRTAFGARDQAPSRPPDPVLLKRRSVVALPGDVAPKNQTRVPSRTGPLPIEQHGREAGSSGNSSSEYSLFTGPRRPCTTASSTFMHRRSKSILSQVWARTSSMRKPVHRAEKAMVCDMAPAAGPESGSTARS